MVDLMDVARWIPYLLRLRGGVVDHFGVVEGKDPLEWLNDLIRANLVVLTW